jgi:hypothetical protein
MPMKVILRLAYRLLVNDKSKFMAFLLGINFAVFGRWAQALPKRSLTCKRGWIYAVAFAAELRNFSIRSKTCMAGRHCATLALGSRFS